MPKHVDGQVPTVNASVPARLPAHSSLEDQHQLRDIALPCVYSALSLLTSDAEGTATSLAAYACRRLGSSMVRLSELGANADYSAMVVVFGSVKGMHAARG